MSKKDIVAMVFAAVAVTAGGCTGPGQAGHSHQSQARGSGEVGLMAELQPMAIPPIRDLPIPLGFLMDEGRSRNFRGGFARYVDHVYHGKADKFAVSRFYMRQMPIQRWVLVTDMFVQGELMLDFIKESESCRVIVTDGKWSESATIKVTLWTSGQIQAPEVPGKSKKR